MGALSLPFIDADIPLDANNISKIVSKSSSAWANASPYATSSSVLP